MRQSFSELKLDLPPNEQLPPPEQLVSKLRERVQMALTYRRRSYVKLLLGALLYIGFLTPIVCAASGNRVGLRRDPNGRCLTH